MITRDPVWGTWVRQNRKSRGMIRRDLARAAGIDASYVTLIERDGYVPARDKVELIGKALGNPDALIMAGFVPANRRLHLLRSVDQAELPTDIRKIVLELAEAPRAVRAQAVAMLEVLIRKPAKPARSRRRPA